MNLSYVKNLNFRIIKFLFKKISLKTKMSKNKKINFAQQEEELTNMIGRLRTVTDMTHKQLNK